MQVVLLSQILRIEIVLEIGRRAVAVALLRGLGDPSERLYSLSSPLSERSSWGANVRVHHHFPSTGSNRKNLSNTS